MNIKKSLLVTGAVATVGIAGITGSGVVSAATAQPASEDGHTSLVDKLVEKFNLNKSEVEAVFEEQKTEREAEQQQRFETRLETAVQEGKLSEEQKDKILAKFAELKEEREANHEAFKTMSKEDVRERVEQQREAIEQWAEENDIPEEYLPMQGIGRHGPMKHDMAEGDVVYKIQD